MNLTRQEKRLYRKKMMQILRGRPIDELTDEEFKEVQTIRKFIDFTTMDDSHPLEKMDFENFTYEKYKKLIGEGYTVKTICKALGVGSSVWAKWRIQNIPEKERERENKREKGVIGKKRRKIIAVYHDGQIVVQGLCEDICWDLGLKPSTVYTYANRQATDSKKRTFKYLEG
ncbi:hypothetical protein [Enterococcus mundtii]